MLLPVNQLLFLRVGRTKKPRSPLQVRRELKRVLVNLGLRSRFSHERGVFTTSVRHSAICFLRFYYVPKIWEQSSRWWFQTFFIFTPTWGNDPIWLIFFKWVETTNQSCSKLLNKVLFFESWSEVLVASLQYDQWSVKSQQKILPFETMHVENQILVHLLIQNQFILTAIWGWNTSKWTKFCAIPTPVEMDERLPFGTYRTPWILFHRLSCYMINDAIPPRWRKLPIPSMYGPMVYSPTFSWSVW